MNHIFNIDGKHARGFLDMDTKEIVVYDDSSGKELFRIGGPQDSFSGNLEEDKGYLTFSIQNNTNQLQNAILFAANREPLIQPPGVVVTIEEIQNTIFDSHNYLRRDILSNPIELTSLKYIVSDRNQFRNVLTFGKIIPYNNLKGNILYSPMAPEVYINPYQAQGTVFEIKDFRGIVDGRSQIVVPMNANTSCTIQFKVIYKSYKSKTTKKLGRSSQTVSSPTIIQKEAMHNMVETRKGFNAAELLIAATFLSIAFYLYK